MPNEYTLNQLAKLSQVSPRTVRYYIEFGLLPAPTQSGPLARYTDEHLDRLRQIRRLQDFHQPLAEIRRRLESLAPEQAAALAEGTGADEPGTDSALDYITRLLQPPGSTPATTVPPQPTPAPMATPTSAPLPMPMPTPKPTPASASAPTSTGTSQWDRITLDPDVELHIRRPLTRQKNRRVERLINIARELLEED